MGERRLDRNAVGRRGKQIYESTLRSQVEGIFDNQFVAIDVETSEYEVAEEAHLAGDKLRKRLSDPQVFVARVGHHAAFYARKTEC